MTLEFSHYTPTMWKEYMKCDKRFFKGSPSQPSHVVLFYFILTWIHREQQISRPGYRAIYVHMKYNCRSPSYYHPSIRARVAWRNMPSPTLSYALAAGTSCPFFSVWKIRNGSSAARPVVYFIYRHGYLFRFANDTASSMFNSDTCISEILLTRDPFIGFNTGFFCLSIALLELSRKKLLSSGPTPRLRATCRLTQQCQALPLCQSLANSDEKSVITLTSPGFFALSLSLGT